MTEAFNFINTYTDTRGLSPKPLTFTQAIAKGIAEGGGLFVPVVMPHLTLDEIIAFGTQTYAQQAATLYKRFGVDLPAETIDTLMATAYGDNFDTSEVAPIEEVAPGTFVLELWHGPTSAFKDMALQCLPVFFSAAINQLRAAGASGASTTGAATMNAADEAAASAVGSAANAGSIGSAADAVNEDFLILVATSGDTGKAALEGFKDRDHTGIIVFYPHGGVSDIQFRQMATQLGENVGVFGVEGNFDNCQTAVKAAFNDAAFNELLAKNHKLKLSSANSINWGRLLPQIIYYVSAYAQLVACGTLTPGEELDICVPTGNFGNILAAYYAKEIGVPIGQLFCASNENRVLADFINTGLYDISERAFTLTPSPSMDILVSSNLERQLFELTGRDPELIRGWMEDLRTERCFRVDKQTFAALRANFRADWVSNNESLETIREVFSEHEYLLDPHTAVAWKVAERLRGENPVLVVSTAHWAKFGTDVYRALNSLTADSELPAEVAALSGTELNELLSTSFGAGAIPSRLAQLAEMPLRFSQVCEGSATGIEAAVTEWLQANT